MIKRRFSSVAVLLALGILTPMQVNAFGLGKLELLSALNEPFKATIPVTALREDEEGNLQVRLATVEEFARAGIERSYYLTQLVFNVVEHPGGATIEVTSQQPIKEPFVDFLITATTGEGRLIREYTVLLDPPKTLFVEQAKKPAATSSKTVNQPSSRTTYNYPESTSQTPETYYSGSTYGPTKQNDTLWDIALATKPSSVSVHQMMIALLNANPEAFIKNNINNLKRGQTLTIPSIDEINKLSHKQAVARVSEQWQQWKNANKVAANTSQEQVSDSMDKVAELPQTSQQVSPGENDARLQLVVDSDDTSTGTDELTPLGNDELTKLRNQLTLAQETIEGQKQENIDFKARMDAMEQQLEIMRKIIMLKDADLARLQSMLGEEEQVELASDNLSDEMQTALEESNVTAPNAESGMTEQDGVEPLPEDEETSVEAELETMVIQAAERVVDEEAVMAAAQAAKEEAKYTGNNVFIGPDPVPAVPVDVFVNTTEESTSFDIDDPLQAKRVYDAEAVAAAAQAAKEEAAYRDNIPLTEVDSPMVEDEMAADLDEELTTTEESVAEIEADTTVQEKEQESKVSLIDKAKGFVSENKTPLLVGVGTVFLGLLAWLFVRRRNEDEYEWVDTASLEEIDEDKREITTADSETSPATEETVATNMEESKEEPEDDEISLDSTEDVADLLNQAEMSIAYGEYDEAAALVEQAKNQDPSNPAVALKLVALAYHQKQTDIFNNLVADLTIDKDSPEWQEVLAWGRELDPENELYADERVADLNVLEDTVEPADDNAGLVEEVTLDDTNNDLLEFELNEEETAATETLIKENEGEDTLSFVNDFDLEKSENTTEDSSLDFDAPISLEIDTDDTPDLVLDIADEGQEQLETELAERAENTGDDVADIEIESITDTLDELEESTNDTLPVVEPGSEVEKDEQIEQLDIGADDLEFDIGDFDEVDEAETKLDLAAAYVDMGDPEGAKNILNEVLTEGNADQKSRAQELLNNLT